MTSDQTGKYISFESWCLEEYELQSVKTEPLKGVRNPSMIRKTICVALLLFTIGSVHAQSTDEARFAALEREGLHAAHTGQCDVAKAKIREMTALRTPDSTHPIDPAIANVFMANE